MRRSLSLPRRLPVITSAPTLPFAPARRDNVAGLKSFCTQSARIVCVLGVGENVCFLGVFPKDNRVGFLVFHEICSWQKVSQPNIHNIPIDRPTIGVFRFPFVSCFGLSAFIHTGGRAGLGWVSLTRALLLYVDMTRASQCHYDSFPYREKE